MQQFPKRGGHINKEPIINQTLPQLCPTGTVLIKRTTKEDLIKAKKYAHQIQSRVQLLQAEITANDDGATHVRFISS